jgi:hypothetical protein
MVMEAAVHHELVDEQELLFFMTPTEETDKLGMPQPVYGSHLPNARHPIS